MPPSPATPSTISNHDDATIPNHDDATIPNHDDATISSNPQHHLQPRRRHHLQQRPAPSPTTTTPPFPTTPPSPATPITIPDDDDAATLAPASSPRLLMPTAATVSRNEESRMHNPTHSHVLPPQATMSTSIRPNDTLPNDEGEETRTHNDGRTTKGEELDMKSETSGNEEDEEELRGVQVLELEEHASKPTLENDDGRIPNEQARPCIDALTCSA
ncbi:hypothetical protein EDD22DRAFT_962793 [Suillus occidentalis]|nr:hypothetical protein EDD22DRAFT_962793 [Suillus occidentalis]